MTGNKDEPQTERDCNSREGYGELGIDMVRNPLPKPNSQCLQYLKGEFLSFFFPVFFTSENERENGNHDSLSKHSWDRSYQWHPNFVRIMSGVLYGIITTNPIFSHKYKQTWVQNSCKVHVPISWIHLKTRTGRLDKGFVPLLLPLTFVVSKTSVKNLNLGPKGWWIRRTHRHKRQWFIPFVVDYIVINLVINGNQFVNNIRPVRRFMNIHNKIWDMLWSIIVIIGVKYLLLWLHSFTI